ncbi:MAG: hypothetical protein WCK05_06950 [Planctomycetota bacterium]|jgi:hypothetical protein
MGGVSRIYRLLRLVTILQGRRSYTAADLAKELEVCRRTYPVHLRFTRKIVGVARAVLAKYDGEGAVE